MIISLFSEIQACNSESCPKTGSSCVNLIGGESLCVCDPDADACKADTSTCYPNPCAHGGTCVVEEYDSFSCECQPDWSGPLCGESKIHIIIDLHNMCKYV